MASKSTLKITSKNSKESLTANLFKVKSCKKAVLNSPKFQVGALTANKRAT